MLTVEQIEEDLCPVFDSFLRDVDEVKIGLLSHLSQFLELLRPETRRIYLDKLTHLTSVDNQRNWRFRLESAKSVSSSLFFSSPEEDWSLFSFSQIFELTSLFSSVDIVDYLCPLAFGMSIDKVADVRLAAIRAVGLLLSSLFLNGSRSIVSSLVGGMLWKVLVGECWCSLGDLCWWLYSFIWSIWRLEMSSSLDLSLWRNLSSCWSIDVDGWILRGKISFSSSSSSRRSRRQRSSRFGNISLSTRFVLFSFLRHRSLFVVLESLKEFSRREVEQCLSLLATDKDRDVRLAVGILPEQRPTIIDEDEDEQSNLSS